MPHGLQEANGCSRPAAPRADAPHPQGQCCTRGSRQSAVHVGARQHGRSLHRHRSRWVAGFESISEKCKSERDGDCLADAQASRGAVLRDGIGMRVRLVHAHAAQCMGGRFGMAEEDGRLCRTHALTRRGPASRTSASRPTSRRIHWPFELGMAERAERMPDGVTDGSRREAYGAGSSYCKMQARAFSGRKHRSINVAGPRGLISTLTL
jgi:hypothetical protein